MSACGNEALRIEGSSHSYGEAPRVALKSSSRCGRGGRTFCVGGVRERRIDEEVDDVRLGVQRQVDVVHVPPVMRRRELHVAHCARRTVWRWDAVELASMRRNIISLSLGSMVLGSQ